MQTHIKPKHSKYQGKTVQTRNNYVENQNTQRMCKSRAYPLSARVAVGKETATSTC